MLMRYLSRAGWSLVLMLYIFGLAQPITQAQESEATPEITEAAPLPTYRVQFLQSGDTLNIYAGPGVDYPVVGTLGYLDEMRATGDEQRVGDELWLPIEAPYDSAVTGWINRLYAVKQNDPGVFCADDDARALADEVITAIRAQDGKQLAQTILPARGLYLGGMDWSEQLHLSEAEVQHFFKDTSSREWGTDMYDPTPITGSIHDLVLPLLASDMLPKDASIICADGHSRAVMPDDAYLETELEALPYYYVMRPGTPGHELDWGAWGLGIDDWDGTPVLAYLWHYFWTT